MSFFSDPGASFEGLTHDPWHSLENFGTTGLVPLIPYVGGIVGGIYGGPAGARAGGAAGQAGVDYFSGNSEARTGGGIFGSLLSGAGKGGMAYGGSDSLGGGDGIMGLFGGDSTNPATGLDWMETGSGYAGNGGYGFDDGSSSGINDYLSSVNPDSQYVWQDQMEQARNTNVPSGSSTSWDRGDKTSFDPSSAQKLLSNLLKNQQGTSQQNATVYNNYRPTDVIRQPAFLGTTAPVDVQNTPLDLTALIKALRG